MAYSPDGRWLVEGFENRDPDSGLDRVTVRDAGTGAHLRSLKGIVFSAEGLAFDRSGRRLIGGGSRGRVVVRDVATWEVAWMASIGEPVRSAALLAGGTRFLALSSGGRLVVGDLAEGGDVREALSNADPSRLAVAPGEDLAVVGGADGSLRVVEIPGLSPRAVAEEAHPGGVGATAISPDGQFLASAGHDRRVVLRELRSLRPLFEFSMPTEQVLDLAFDRDGARLAACGASEPVIIWDLAAIRREMGRLGLAGDLPAGAGTPAPPTHAPPLVPNAKLLD